MTTYYVSPTGVDTNNGTSQSTPWQTLSHVNAFAFAAGDTCLFQGNGWWVGNATTGQQLQPSTSGASGNPITFGTYGTGNAYIYNSTVAGNYNGILVYDINYVTFNNFTCFGPDVMVNTTTSGVNAFSASGVYTGITINNCQAYGWYVGILVGSNVAGAGFSNVTINGCTTNGNFYAGIWSYGTGTTGDGSGWQNSNITVTNCVATDNLGNKAVTTKWTGSGILLSSTNGGTISGCTASGNGQCNSYTSGGGVGIWAYYSNNVTISGNIAFSNQSGTQSDGDGFDLDIGCTNCTLEYNIAWGNWGAGILLDADSAANWNGNTVRYNITWGNGQNPLTAAGGYGELTTFGPMGAHAVYNNTFVATTSPLYSPACITAEASSSTNGTYRNNIFYMAGTGHHILTTVAYASTAVLFQGNNYSGATLSIDWNGTTYTTMAAWQAVATNQEQNGATNYGTMATATANPNFVNVSQQPTVWSPTHLFGAYGLQMTTSSTLLSAGLNLNSLFGTVVGTQDYFGNTLSSWPIGASYTSGYIGTAPTLTTRLFKGSTNYARLTA